MKIAFATDDGKTISAHFGRASHYMVVTIEQGQPVQREMRDKLSHTHFENEPHGTHEPGQPHGFDPASQDRHVRMVEAIRDCEAMLCQGMGLGAYESLRTANIRPIVTDISDIEQAVTAFIKGDIVDHTEKLH
ncbi:MAG: dinitrogenase iron-molybdenum cofactor biosynthesis protein [Chloroflexi bacterium]|nr:dinitrogenase iron-molybdenum cofactor biosynthesis protein [Chloroflexota bacterium]